MQKKILKNLSIGVVSTIILGSITISLSNCSYNKKTFSSSTITNQDTKNLDIIAKNIKFKYDIFENEDEQIIKINKIKVVGDLGQAKIIIKKVIIEQKSNNFFVQYQLSLHNRTKEYTQNLEINKKQSVIETKYINDELINNDYRPFALKQLLTSSQNIKKTSDLSLITMQKNNQEFNNYFNFIQNEDNFKQLLFNQATLLTKQNQLTDHHTNFKFERIEIDKQNQIATVSFSHDSDSQTIQKILNATNKRLLIKNFD